MTILMVFLICSMCVFAGAVLGNGKALSQDMHKLEKDVSSLSRDLVQHRQVPEQSYNMAENNNKNGV